MSDDGRWGSREVAEVWRRGAEVRNQVMRPATDRMFDEAGVGPGARVLDLGTGTGDTAILAAERVGPSGHVVAIDSSLVMVEAAKEALVAAGVSNATALVMDADTIDFDEGSFDAVVGRQVLMFLDLDGVLPRIRRVLRPGGRLAAVVWAALADNPLHAALLDSSRAHGGWGDDPPEMARAFERGDPEVYRAALERASLREPRVATVVSARSFASAAEALTMARESPLMSAPIAALPPALRDTAWTEVAERFRRFERDGSCTFAMTCFVVSGAR